jgi:hypothetical protein
MKFHIHWFSFLIAFSVMMLYVYMSLPKAKIVVTHPTPFNAGKIIYHDATGTCYVFDAIEVIPCDAKLKNVKKQPIAEKFVNSDRID